MKPRIRRVDGFWHCVTPDAQGLGITPEIAYREYMDMWIDMQLARIEAGRKERERKEIEYQTELATIKHRTLMAAYGLETDKAGNVVRDYWVEALRRPTGAAKVGFAAAPIKALPAPRPKPRWWEFWK